jgi:hypothetical protein
MFITSCNNSHNDQTIENRSETDSTHTSQKKDTLIRTAKEKDTIKSDSQIKTAKTNKKHQNNIQNKNKEKSPPLLRYSDSPDDENFNGKPMTQQEDISKNILEKHPDTLSKIAIARYKAFDNFFPKSIADNFEKGISTEHIYYPEKLIFRFELFENEVSWEPYIVKEIIVRRNANGELYTE